MNPIRWLLTVILAFALTTACSPGAVGPAAERTPDGHPKPAVRQTKSNPPPVRTGTPRPRDTAMADVKKEIIRRFGKQIPHQWGLRVAGVKTRIRTGDPVIALTFDACGGPGGSGYDRQIIEYLNERRIPATLFVNSRWIDANRDVFLRLAKNPLFEIENHGTGHKPLSVGGRSAYGIAGTRSVGEVVDEVWINERKIRELTGRKPLFFRSGTAHYDEVAVRVVNALGEEVVNFDVLGDAGATYSAAQVEQALLRARPGAIVILHMNRPDGETAEGLIRAIPRLERRGFTFVKLEDYAGRLE